MFFKPVSKGEVEDVTE